MDVKKILLEKIEEQTPVVNGSTRTWHLQDPKLLYVTEEQADGYLALEDSEDYKSGMHDAETDLIQRNLEFIVSQLKEDVRVIDMGCGEALKTLEILKEAQKRGKRIIFYPIDISDKILDIAVKNSLKAGIETHGLQEDFEQLPQIIRNITPG
ncbi:L-histidine N(alpha)-methyltransferase, partial [Candidatus Woesearchaeota archaeon]|nr:L-histidine N(alpha)-methyltransferase [Candidatus Woesearchaeota archaeon]